MRFVTGAILLLAAEQAFAHAHLIGFPHTVFAQNVLLPCSVVLFLFGCGFLVWGVFADRKGT
jgi:hypothetical protein